ncbi:N6-L-threonylcarbamoyladenine synthase, TsaE subunit [Campylobacter blaseri]|uniref:tRNA threonylcarbamoyladenosine biosynthesis protein TsaE n=1 Tax=Campylobacter blaseri TaxID=2042961 RepID=A0A2P8R2H4_9BACT|nr:tRNA (adenosine(37)-N6)-threonylcarbamoyltransferase complex ATPase subunit type 1 TsaE [Campylobacter blaseri]PSM52691.1 tRNA (adenosine(37)-N6)-threonylcarbamoyltransferase complex ATPase subunit type 1 TsaE [Campylobacter blaseri]PSM54339.1 tRNA (adenosine(37)-N6)-threonylcarbamoyltransferase complex ATPase subunit type 1 TsaE [Campylobacter blaseri]QKF85992.1 N6-L-threonylcarbamoyladenine synthase, TsaE subunit [Campylobacter blaseri]
MQNFEIILSENELEILAKKLPKEGVIILKGNLASGKTTLTKAIIHNLGIIANVSSPTFSVMQNYEDVFHYDIYQNGVDGLKKNGLFENFFEDGLHIVEWGDDELIALLNKFEIKCCVINIEIYEDKRKYKVSYA